MLLAALTTLQKVGIVAGIVVGIGGLLFAAISAWLAVSNERKRTQPIIMANQVGERRFVERSGRFAVVMPTALTGQNGAQIHEDTPVAVSGCPRASTAKPKKRPAKKRAGHAKKR